MSETLPPLRRNVEPSAFDDEFDLTANFGLRKPWEGADLDEWGHDLNYNMDLLDNLLQTRGFADDYLPLTGGAMSGPVTHGNPGGAVNITRTVAWSGNSADAANKPFNITNTFTGTVLDAPTAGPAVSMGITQLFDGFNGSGFGMRTLQFATQIGPLSLGTYDGVLSQIAHYALHPPGTNVWVPGQSYGHPGEVFGITNDLCHYEVVTPGVSALAGPGPTGYGQSITDGSVVWAYAGPAVPRYWVPGGTYPTRGEVVTNPNNGGLFRVETPGIAGAAPGPVRIRGAWPPVRLAATANTALTGTPPVDGAVPVIGDRVMLPAQTDQTTNGIYIVAAGAWTRSVETSNWDYLPGGYATVTEGAVNAGLTFTCTVPPGGTFGTDPITFAQIPLPNRNAIPDGGVVWSQKGVGSSAHSYIGLTGQVTTSFNMGGRGLSETVGHQWGGVVGSTVGANATNVTSSIGLEIDDRVLGTARQAVGCQIVRQGNQAMFLDVGLIVNALGYPGYRHAFQLSNCTDTRSGYGMSWEGFGIANFQHMAGCLDMKMVVPDGALGPFGGGFLLRSPNGSYDQFGAWQLRFASITPTASGLDIDVPNVELKSVVIAPGNGGANFSKGDGWKGNDGSWGKVLTVGAAGAMVTASVLGPSQVRPPGPATIIMSPFNAEPVNRALGFNPIPGTVGPTGDSIWPTPATGTPTYAAPATRTLNIGAASLDVINIGRAGATTTLAGTVVLPATSSGAFLGLGGGTLTGPTTISGNGTAITPQANTLLNVVGGNGAAARIELDTFAGLPLFTFRSALGTAAAPLALQGTMGTINFIGYDGSAYSASAATISAMTSGTPFSPTNHGAYLTFSTTAVGATTLVEAMRLQMTGNVTIGATADNGNRLDVQGGTARIGGGLGVFNHAAPTVQPALTGAKGGNTALASVIAVMVAAGFATDATTA